MKNGDLSNSPAPRIYVVFDDCVSSLDERDKEAFYMDIERGDYYGAVFIMKENLPILNKITWLSNKRNINVYLVTWMNQGMAEAIEEYMNDIMVPIRGCLSLTPGQLARMTAQDESVIGIYDPDPDHLLTYGAKGRILRTERDLS